MSQTAKERAVYQKQWVRAVLCSMCNIGLGKFRESKRVLRAAIAYLERHSR